MKEQWVRKSRGFFRRIGTLSLAAAVLLALTVTASAAGLELSTDYPGISARAGETLSFSLDIENGSGAGSTVSLTESSLPDGWEGYFTGGGNEISSVFAKSGENIGIATYYLTIPDGAEEGDYQVVLLASGGGMSSSLTLTLHVTAQEHGGSSLTADYADQEGSSDASFSYGVTIQNDTGAEQTYSLSASAPTGWTVTFTPSGESTHVAGITVAEQSSQGLTVTVTPPAGVDAGEYTIPISAISATENLSVELTANITGTYTIDLSTPSGLLSFDANANRETSITLTITNTGNVDQQNINLTSSVPTDWSVTFSESTIDVLEAGATKEVTMYVTPSSDALSGDYAMSVTAQSSSSADSVEFRVAVKTEMIWGVVGLLLIAAAACGLWYVFRKYGRR